MSFLLGPVLDGLFERPRQDIWEVWQSAIPKPDEAVKLRYYGVLTEVGYYEVMARNGFAKTTANELYELARAKIATADLVNLHRRGFVDDKLYKELALENGFSEDRLALAEKALQFYPSVGDLIRFAVREVYTPDIRAQYGLEEDFPPEFAVQAKKAGLGEQDARNFWSAHWELPSVLMGYEMFHRGIITLEELKTLLRTLDIMPFWRDKLIALSFQPFTRIDIRRMFRLGILTFDQMIRAHMDIGYNEEKARQLSEFVRLDQTPEEEAEAVRERDLAKTEILKLYMIKELTPERTQEMLRTLGYDEQEALYLVKLTDHQAKTAEQKEVIDLLLAKRAKGLINDSQLQDELNKLELSDIRKQTILLKAKKEREQSQKTASIDDLRRWATKKLLEFDDFINYMVELNVRPDVIALHALEIYGSGAK